MPAKALKLKINKPTTPEEFDKHGDDSSDDEIDNLVQAYNLNDKYELFNEAEDKSLDDKLSFIAHALSLKVLYSPQANKYYSELKAKYLSTRLYEQITETLKKLLVQTLLDAFEKIAKQFLCKNNLAALSDIELKNFAKSVLDELEKTIDAFISFKTKGIIHFLKNNRHRAEVWREACTKQKFTESEEPLKEVENTFLDEVIAKYLTKIQETHFKYRTPLLPTEANINNHYANLLRLNTFIIDDALRIAEKLAPQAKTCSSLQKKMPKQNEKDTLETEYPYFFTQICTILTNKIKENNGGRVHLSTLFDDKVNVLRESYMRYLYARDASGAEGDVELISLEPWQISHEVKDLKFFLTVDDDRLQEDLSLLIQEKFNLCLDKFVLERQMLPLNGNLISKTPHGFFALKRLVDRSQRRTIRNISQTKFQSFGSTTTWQWQFSETTDTRVPEEQNITYNASTQEFGRNDRVITAGTYKELLSYLEKLKSQLKAHKLRDKDKDIASDIRIIFKGELPKWMNEAKLSKIEKQMALNFLSSITYLLLGCETRRNPGLIILNQMLLDLIIADKLTWETAFKAGTKERGGIMPMAPKGAVSIGRQLNSDYKKYLPRPYDYEGTEKENDKAEIDKENLITYEAAIFVRWIQYKNPEKYAENLSFENLKAAIDQVTTENLTVLVEHAFFEWFDVTPERAASQIPAFC